MKVRMKVSLSGTRDGLSWPPIGEVVELPDGEAAWMCSADMAAPVANMDGDVETATVPDDAELRSEPKRRGRPPKAQA